MNSIQLSILESLKERGFVKQCSDEAALSELLAHTCVTYYIGFDPTADSLHVGSLVPIMAMAHLQKTPFQIGCLELGFYATLELTYV